MNAMMGGAKMENQSMLWAHAEKTGFLMKQGGDVKSWKKRFHIVKDTFLFYFKNKGDTEPAGIVPLQGCSILPPEDDSDAPTEHCFAVAVAQGEEVGVVKRHQYIFAAEDRAELAAWVDAVRGASESKRSLRAQVDQARAEVRELEQRWLVAAASDAGMPMVYNPPPMASSKGDPAVIAALNEDLSAAKRDLEQAQQRLATSSSRSEQSMGMLQQVEATIAEQEGKIMALADYLSAMPYVQSDVASCDECLEWLLPARAYLSSLKAQADALSGAEGVVAEGVPTPMEIEALLRNTSNCLSALEYQGAGLDTLADETRIAMLQQTLSLYEHMLLSSAGLG